MRTTKMSGKRMITEKWVSANEAGLTVSKTIKQWIQDSPDIVLNSIWLGKLEITKDAHTLLMREIETRFAEMYSIHNKRKAFHGKNKTAQKRLHLYKSPSVAVLLQ